MNNNPFFSVITASYNSQRTISRTIESLLNQDYTDFEYIIIDGNSKDKTLEIIKSFETKFRKKNITYKYISEPDNGIYDAWNKGVELTKGKWISFIGSDDYYEKDALKNYFNKISLLNNDVNYISSKVDIINDKGKIIKTIGKKFIWNNIIKNMDTAQVGSFHRRDLLEKVGKFSLEYKIVGDLDFYIRSKDFIKPFYFDEITAKMENNGVSNQINKALNEALKVRLKSRYDSKIMIYINHYILLTKCYVNLMIKK